MQIYGLTGGIASGKSTVARLLEAGGARVIDADRIAREVVAPGTEGLAAVLAEFGEEYRRADGALDRELLGRLVFRDSEARARLNRILHPRIAVASAEEIRRAMERGERPVFYDAALLVENGLHRGMAGLVVVACSEAHQLERLMRRDGLSEEEARRRIAAQTSTEIRVRDATWVIWNDGPEDALASRVDEVLRAIREQEGDGTCG